MVRSIAILDGDGHSLAAAVRALAQEERHAQQQIALSRLVDANRKIKKGKVVNHGRFSQGLDS